MTEYRTFRIQSPRMKGSDVQNWEEELKDIFLSIGIRAPIVSDGTYGDIDRSYTKSLCYALGMEPAEVMAHGITPELRVRLRHHTLTSNEKKRMDERVDWRRRLRERYRQLAHEDQGKVSRFLLKTLQDTWGYHPGVHDGIDLISLPDVPIFAPIRAKVFDVRSGGWWSKGAPADPTLRAKGDGIVQLEVLENEGPFKKGYHIGLGHAEKAFVEPGDVVDAGDKVAHTGFANAWHIHLMYNDGSTFKGIGNLDPRSIVDYTISHT